MLNVFFVEMSANTNEINTHGDYINMQNTTSYQITTIVWRSFNIVDLIL